MSQGNNYPKGPANRTLGMSEVRLVSRTTGNLVFSDDRNADVPNAVPVFVEGGNITIQAEATVQLEGVYNAVTNPNPDNTGIIVFQNSVTPGDIQQTVRPTGGVSNITIASNTFYGLDARSKLYAKSGLNEQELAAITIGTPLFGLGVGVFSEDGNRLIVDGYGNLLVDIDGLYDAALNPNPDNVGLTVSENAAIPADANQVVRLTGDVSNITITSTTFYGLDTRSKLYAKDGVNEQELHAITLGGTDFGLGVGVFDDAGDRWEITAEGYGFVDPLTIRGNEDEPASDGGAQVMLEALNGQKAAVDSGDAVRAVGNLYGEQVNAGYTWATNSSRTEEISPLDQKYITEQLVSDLSLADSVYDYYIDMSGYRHAGIQFNINTGIGICDGYCAFAIDPLEPNIANKEFVDVSNALFNSASLHCIAGTPVNDFVFIDTTQPIEAIRIRVANTTGDTASVQISYKKSQ